MSLSAMFMFDTRNRSHISVVDFWHVCHRPGTLQSHSVNDSRLVATLLKLLSHVTSNCTVYQCFLTFSLKRNPLQQFWLITEPMGIARNLSWGRGYLWCSKGQNSRTKAESGEWVWAPPHQLLGMGGWQPRPQMHVGRTKSPESAYTGRKCHLVPVSRFHSAEPLDAARRTLRFHRTPVEKHCCVHSVTRCLNCRRVWNVVCRSVRVDRSTRSYR